MRMSTALISASLSALLATSGALAHDVGVSLQLIGDGKISHEPKSGYLFACQSSGGGLGGADALGPWAQNGVWKPDAKPNAKGAVEWPNALFSLTVEAAQRVVHTNGLPAHKTGAFPIERTDPVYKFDRNPNHIAEQNVLLRLPAVPIAAVRPTCVPMGMIGFALTGAAIFNAVDAGGRDAPAHEIQDSCSGHPEQGGVYHYHDYSPCMVDISGKAGRHSDLVGYALDGFGIFGPRGEGGRRLKDADLDACHGHLREIMWDGQKRVMYHYHFTDEYPYSVGCFMGTPVPAPKPSPVALRPSAAPAALGTPLTGAPPPAAAPPLASPPLAPLSPANARDEAALLSAARQLGVDPDRLRGALGPPPPNFARAAQELGLPESRIRDAMQRARAGR